MTFTLNGVDAKRANKRARACTRSLPRLHAYQTALARIYNGKHPRIKKKDRALNACHRLLTAANRQNASRLNKNKKKKLMRE